MVTICENFFTRYPEFHIVRHFMDKVQTLWSEHDKRDDDLTIYQPEVVLTVVLFAKESGCTNFKQYAYYWFWHNLYLQYLIPGMPEPKYMVSAQTIRTVCTLVPDDLMDKLFEEFFAQVRKLIKEDTNNYQDLPSSFFDDELGINVENLKTVGFEGQELRASSQEGKISRKCKQHGVSLYACEDNTVLAAECVHKKNNELSAFFKLHSRVLGVLDDHLIISDALNARDDFFFYCDSNGIDYCMPIMSAFGNKELFKSYEDFFTEDNLKTLNSHEIFTQSLCDLEHGRYETDTYTLVNASHFKDLLPSKRIKSVLCRVKHSKRVVKTATKEEQAKLNDSTEVHFFVLSLDFCKATLLQAIHSIKVHWNYESHHNILDTVLMQDMQAVKKDKTANFVIKSNKMVFNLLTYIRQVKTRTTKRGAVKVPTYNDVIEQMRTPLVIYKYLLRYFLDRPESEQE